MKEQVLHITTNLGYWSDINSHDNVVIHIQTKIGSFDDRNIIPLSNAEYIPQKGDKVYFLPGVNVPRVKFKDLAIKYDIKTVRNPNDANVIFGNRSTSDKITENTWNYKIKTKFLVNALENDLLLIDEIYIEKLKTALEFYTNEFILVDHPLILSLNINQYDNIRLFSVSEDYIELISSIEGKLIYEESTIVDKLNGDDASIINQAMFEQLTTMFESSDDDNHILAMEIIANCKYTASLPYMLLLFKNFSGEMYSSHTKNHVNFKSLLSWLGGNILHRNTLDDLCDILKNKGQFIPENLDILLNHSHKDILNRGDSKYFKIKVITLEEEELTNLNTNYEYKTINKEYVPVEIEEEIVDEAIEAEITIMEKNEPESDLIELETSLTKENLIDSEEHNISEEELAHDLYGVDNDNIEVSLTPEPESNNNQITQTNGIDNIDWF